MLAADERGPRSRRGDDGIGALRIEVWGARPTGERDVVVYGLLDNVAIAAGSMLAIAATRAAQGRTDLVPGVHSLAAVRDPLPWLHELIERGVRPAVFEGAPVT